MKHFKPLILIFAFLVSLTYAYASSTTDMSNIVPLDTFDRVDSATVGTATTGQTWNEKEIGSSTASIENNQLKIVHGGSGSGSNTNITFTNFGYTNKTKYYLWNASGDAGGFQFSNRPGFISVYDDKGMRCWESYFDTDVSGFIGFDDADGRFALFKIYPAQINASFLFLKTGSVTGALIVNLANDTGTSAAENYTRNMENLCLNFTTIKVLEHRVANTHTHFISNISGENGTAGAAPPASQINITITAQDIYDSVPLTNFSIDIKGAENFTQLTLNGSIPITNLTGTFYNITFFTNANGTYFNRTYLNINATGAATLQGQLFQSLLNLYVNDSLTKTAISSFSVRTNFTSYDVSGGYILLYSKAGENHLLNISSSQYPKQTHNYRINAGNNITFTANMSPQFNFYLRREADNSIFDINGTNTTRLTIFCPSKNVIVYFKNESNGGSATAKVSTQENATIDCPYTLLKMDITYTGSSYFRSLIPSKSQQNVTWWLLDLNKDTGVQMIINLRDLTGEFSQGILRAKTAIGANNENIIEEYFDISTSVVLYLLKDALYKIVLINNAQTKEKQLGDLIADAAGTKTITAQDIGFIPDTVLDNNVSWSYTFNVSANILRLQYLDSTKNTTYIRWRIYNGTNTSGQQLLTTFESVYIAGNFSSTTYTYNNLQFNRTYFTHLFARHSGLSFNISEYRSFGEYESYLGQFAGFTAKAAKDIRHYGSAIFLSVWMLLFSARHLAIGLTSTLFWIVILKIIGYFLIGWVWIMIIGLVTFFTWIADYMKRN